MSEIVFPATHRLIDETDIIEFPARVDGKVVTCRITLEEMGRDFMRGTNPATFEEAFQDAPAADRGTSEEVASGEGGSRLGTATSGSWFGW